MRLRPSHITSLTHSRRASLEQSQKREEKERGAAERGGEEEGVIQVSACFAVLLP